MMFSFSQVIIIQRTAYKVYINYVFDSQHSWCSEKSFVSASARRSWASPLRCFSGQDRATGLDDFWPSAWQENQSCTNKTATNNRQL